MERFEIGDRVMCIRGKVTTNIGKVAVVTGFLSEHDLVPGGIQHDGKFWAYTDGDVMFVESLGSSFMYRNIYGSNITSMRAPAYCKNWIKLPRVHDEEDKKLSAPAPREKVTA